MFKKSNIFKTRSFTLNKILGEGQYSTIWDATLNNTYHPNYNYSNNFALKIPKYNLKEFTRLKQLKFFINEIDILYKLKHNNIIKFYEELKTDHNTFGGLCLQKGNDHDLFSVIDKGGKMHDLLAKYYFKKLIKSIKYCHEYNVAHRDIKLENILLDENYNLLLSEFGLSLNIKDNNFLIKYDKIKGTGNIWYLNYLN